MSSQPDLDQLQRRIGYQFKSPERLLLALTHRSYGNQNNERLEFLGDSIVNMVIAEYLFLHFEKAREGQLSRLRARMVKGVTLAEIGREFQLGAYLRLGSGELKSGGLNTGWRSLIFRIPRKIPRPVCRNISSPASFHCHAMTSFP